MSSDIKIPRLAVTAATEALQWSNDGQLALISGPTATILSPCVNPNSDKTYDTTSTSSIEHSQWFLADIPLTNDHEVSLGSTSTDYVITDLTWSPSGLSPIRGCFLATVTSRHEAFIYIPSGNPSTDIWRSFSSLNSLLLQDLDISAPISRRDIQSLRIHSLAWSPKAEGDAFERVWGTSFVAVGLESGCVVIYQIDHSGITFIKSLDTTFDSWIVNIEWSSWHEKDGHLVSCLSIGTSANSLHIIVLDLDQKSGKLETVGKPTEIMKANRKRISIMKWLTGSSDKDYNVLLAATSGHIFAYTVYASASSTHAVLDFRAQDIPTSIQLDICGISSRPSTAVSNTSSIDVDLVSCHAGIQSLAITPVNNSNNPVSESVLARFVKHRTSISEVETESKVFMQCYGASAHPHATYMALLYSLYPKDRLRYPITSQSSYRIAFVPLAEYESIISFTPRAYSVSDGSAESTWWELKFMEKQVPKKKRAEFKDHLLKELEVALPDAGSAIPILQKEEESSLWSPSLAQALQNALYLDPRVDSLRLLHYFKDYHGNDEILQLLAETVLLWVSRAKNTDSIMKNAIDCAILQSLSGASTVKAPNNIESLVTGVAMPGANFTEIFDFNKARSALSLRSESNHVWKRCSITLLPLTLTDTKSCTGCSRRVVSKRSLESRGIQPGLILSTLLDTLKCCIFCGGRLYQRN